MIRLAGWIAGAAVAAALTAMPGAASAGRPAPACNYWKSTADGPVLWPLAAGTSCTYGGQRGVCDGGLIIKGQLEPEQIGQCDVISISTLRTKGKYLIAAVWYAVPGPGSSTTYSSMSQTGTSTSASIGKSNTVTFGVSGSFDFLGLAGSGYDIDYSQVWSDSSTKMIDSVMTHKEGETLFGPGFDTIDHNYDEVVLLLGPDIVFTSRTLRGRTTLTWALDSSRATVYPLKVGWLNGAFGPMPSNMAADLYKWGGITEADFPQILAAAPYAHDAAGTARPGTDRFECVFQPPYIPGNANLKDEEISNTYTSADTNVVSHSYTVRLGLSQTLFGQKFNLSDSLTWSNSSSTKNTFTNGNTVKLSLRQPSSGYDGPTILNVYVDKIYKTLMYSFLPPLAGNASCLGEQELEAILAAGL